MKEITVPDCIGCGICINICPNNRTNGLPFTFGIELSGLDTFLLEIIDGNIKMTDVRLCDGCRTCIEYCPTEAANEVLNIRNHMRNNWIRARRRYLEG